MEVVKLKQIFKTIIDILYNGDYIVEEYTTTPQADGTSKQVGGVWYYRKWKSGKFEEWIKCNGVALSFAGGFNTNHHYYYTNTIATSVPPVLPVSGSVPDIRVTALGDKAINACNVYWSTANNKISFRVVSVKARLLKWIIVVT